MAKRKHRSAQGKMVDMNALIANNETVPSIGNMPVNARGDEILPDGTIIKTREELMKEYHNLSTMIPEDGPIPENIEDAAEIDAEIVADAQTTFPWDLSEVVDHSGNKLTPGGNAADLAGIPAGDLAAAVAATKKVKAKVVKPKNPKKEKGVSRI